MGKIILTSKGLNQKSGRQIIRRTLRDDELCGKRIICFTLAEYDINQILTEACIGLGFDKNNITIYDGEECMDYDGVYDYVYVTEGNTFDIIHMLRRHKMDEFIKVMVLNQNATYIGASAGAMLAGCSFELALDFDKNRAGIDDFSGFDIIKGKTAIIPHYTKKEFEKYVRYYRREEPEVLKKYDRLEYVSNYGLLVIDE